MMKAILSFLLALSVLPFYAFDRSQNPKLYDEVLEIRNSDYSQFVSGGSRSGESGGDAGGSGDAGDAGDEQIPNVCLFSLVYFPGDFIRAVGGAEMRWVTYVEDPQYGYFSMTDAAGRVVDLETFSPSLGISASSWWTDEWVQFSYDPRISNGISLNTTMEVFNVGSAEQSVMRISAEYLDKDGAVQSYVYDGGGEGGLNQEAARNYLIEIGILVPCE